ncbi:sugar kinase [Oleisolibacter albus]|uniref:sugar kinase n=1 Tax=Oleisolibacter albus TaxID=2171757 RepID=UPI000DF4AC7D|nr:sugar kinase [Oleisolibacter albus]
MDAKVVCFGELLLRLTAPGRELLLQSPQLQTCFGGAEANVAVSLARLGQRAAMVSTLPDNALGAACLGELRRHGVDVGGVRTGAGRMGLYFLQVGAVLRPSDILYDRADSAFALADPAGYDWDHLLQGATWLHLSGITPAVSSRAEAAAMAAMEAARTRGLTISFDGNYRPKLWQARGGDAAAILHRMAAAADLIFGNERDVALLLGRDFSALPPDARFQAAAGAAFDAFPRLHRLVSTTRGHASVDDQSLGGQMATRSGLVRATPRDLSGIADRIGGGDAFAAGLLHGLLRGFNDQTALDFAVAAACLKHSIPGDANLVSEADVQALLEGAGLDVRR